jgi:hypothetical protein
MRPTGTAEQLEARCMVAARLFALGKKILKSPRLAVSR